MSHLPQKIIALAVVFLSAPATRARNDNPPPEVICPDFLDGFSPSDRPVGNQCVYRCERICDERGERGCVAWHYKCHWWCR